MKTFLGLRIREYNTPVTALIFNYVATIVLTAIWYFTLNTLLGILGGNMDMYVQPVEEKYIVQGILLLCAIILSSYTKGILNIFRPIFFHYHKLDRWFYPIGLILTYLIIAKVLGL